MITEQDLIDFVYREAELLDERRFEEWYELFVDDGHYWIPLRADQPDPLNHVSLMYEDKLLLKARIERLGGARTHSQQPESRCQHVLQRPSIVSMDATRAGNSPRGGTWCCDSGTSLPRFWAGLDADRRSARRRRDPVASR